MWVSWDDGENWQLLIFFKNGAFVDRFLECWKNFP
jgi:hypothetical protein